MVITGRAYGRRATLEVTGDALTWRARKGAMESVAENIATTIDDIQAVSWMERKWSPGGAVLLVLSGIWLGTESLTFGLVGLACAIGLLAFRAAKPLRWLALDVRGRWLVMRIDAASARDARALSERIDRRLLTGETIVSPPTLP